MSSVNRTYDTTSPYHALRDVQLGDVITLGGSQALSVRAVERALAAPVGTMSGFILAGEVGPQAALLGIPLNPTEPVGVYTPLDHIPPHARGAVAMCQGVISYWAPHLPGLSGAQGELGYKVARVRGSVDPLVLVWRGAERVVFIRTTTFPVEQLVVESLPRDARNTEVDQVRYAATVGSSPSITYPTRHEVPAAHPLTRVLQRLR